MSARGATDNPCVPPVETIARPVLDEEGAIIGLLGADRSRKWNINDSRRVRVGPDEISFAGFSSAGHFSIGTKEKPDRYRASLEKRIRGIVFHSLDEDEKISVVDTEMFEKLLTVLRFLRNFDEFVITYPASRYKLLKKFQWSLANCKINFTTHIRHPSPKSWK